MLETWNFHQTQTRPRLDQSQNIFLVRLELVQVLYGSTWNLTSTYTCDWQIEPYPSSDLFRLYLGYGHEIAYFWFWIKKKITGWTIFALGSCNKPTIIYSVWGWGWVKRIRNIRQFMGGIIEGSWCFEIPKKNFMASLYIETLMHSQHTLKQIFGGRNTSKKASEDLKISVQSPQIGISGKL